MKLVPHPANTGAPTLMGAFTAMGRLAFDLLAVWPVQRAPGPLYHDILMTGLDRYADLLRSGRVVLAGDLNSSTRVLNQKHTHPVFVQRAAALGLVSAYHEQTGERHGEETVATYLHNSGPTREFHIDYCFVAEALKGHVKVSVLNNSEWAARGDHFPVVLDVNDEVLKES